MNKTGLEQEPLPGWATAAPAPNPTAWAWVIRIPDWTPPSVNEVIGRHFSAVEKVKKAATGMISHYARVADVRLVSPAEERIGTAVVKGDGYTPRRRVTVTAYYPERLSRLPDPDNLTKILFDALKRSRVIVDDSAAWLDWDRPKVLRNQDGPFTYITVCDLIPGREPWPPPLPDKVSVRAVYESSNGGIVRDKKASRRDGGVT